MLCLACGAEMILVQVVKDTTMLVSGYEHHTWQCSGCSTIEQRMTFTREKTPTQTASVEPTQTVAVEPTQAAPVEPTQAAPVKATQIVPGEPTQTVAVKPTQTAPVKPTHPEPPAAMFQSSAWAKALEKLRSFKERATETEQATCTVQSRLGQPPFGSSAFGIVRDEARRTRAVSYGAYRLSSANSTRRAHAPGSKA